MLSIVLSRNDYKEFDQIVALFTNERGKVRAIAKGIKKITSKNSSNLEVLSLCDVEIASGKEIDRITKVQPVESFSGIRFDVGKLFAASYAAIVVERLTHDLHKDENLFVLLQELLKSLDSCSKSHIVNLISGFLFKLSGVLGFGFEYKKCSKCGGIIDSARTVGLSAGGMCCFRCDGTKGRLSISDEDFELLKIMIECDLSSILPLKQNYKVHNLALQFISYHSGHIIGNFAKQGRACGFLDI